MVEKIFMSVKQKCDNALIMLFYKFIDGSKSLMNLEMFQME